MNGTEYSPRQVAVLTVTALLAPAAELLPGLLSREVGSAAWLVPVLLLPAALLWTAMLGRLFREEGSGLFPLLSRRLGRYAGGGAAAVYLLWGCWLLARQLRAVAHRMTAVYTGQAGSLAAVLLLLLAAWLALGRPGALVRAGELFWLAMAVTAVAVLLLALPQCKVEYLRPAWNGGRGWLRATGYGLDLGGTAVLSTALLTRVPRRPGTGRQIMGWTAAGCLLAAGLLAAVVGQLGAGLTGRLDHPFFLMVQGLSLEGAIARLEAPVAALWLMADGCRAGLILAALREAGGECWGRRLGWCGCAAAAVLWLVQPGEPTGWSGGLLLGVLLPALLFFLEILSPGQRGKGISCGGSRG